MAEKILIIDDEVKTFKKSLEEILDNYELFFADNGAKGIRIIKDEVISLVLLDVKMPAKFNSDLNKEGIAVLKEIKKLKPELPVIMLTVSSDVEIVVEAIKEGAFHYLLKPPDCDKLISIIEKALENSRLRGELTYFKNVVKVRDQIDSFKGKQQNKKSFGALIGQSQAMQVVYHKVEKVAKIDASVLIKGPTGSGKELVAREIHKLSQKKGHFVPINCSAIPDALLETELFGYEKGAFTGADSNRKGKFEHANRGTIFLDEIADMPLLLQAKLLRVLQDKIITPLGKNDPMQIDVRIISATNKDIEKLIKEGKFREDLYYRLNVISVDVPSLMDRLEDISLLAEHFVKKYSRQFNKKITEIDSKLMERFAKYSWPGNVRELEGVIQKLIAMSETSVLTDDDLDLPKVTSSYSSSSINETWQTILNKTFKIEDITVFRNTYGSKALEEIISRAIAKTRDIKEAGVLIGYIPEKGDDIKYANFRQWLTRLGLSKKDILAKVRS
ncbi:MAG: sigma-54 dependent transcriptional regulator [Elusimicrobia bacterium]|nr:sigma-54 dependent transcriptional regulator [Elusimicrobiota bacterium]